VREITFGADDLFLQRPSRHAGSIVPGSPHVSISLVNRLKKLREARRLVHRPKTMEAGTEHLHITLGQQAYGYDTII